MLFSFTRIFFPIICIWLPFTGQSQCENQYAYLLGSIIEDEKGYSLTASPDGQFVYVGGIKKDSALILKLSMDGHLEWSRTFDIVHGRQDHIHKLFVDAEGMLGVAGTAGSQTGGGTVFVMRYNPETNTILWANEYISTSINFCLGMIEKPSGGNYLLSNNPSDPNVAELVELDKTNGAVVTAFSKHYEMGTSEAFYDFTWNNGMLYATGRFSDGGSVAEMRNTLARIDPTDGSIDWMKLGHRSGTVAARLYGFDIVILNNFIYSVYSGDDNGSSIDNTKIFLQKADLSGNLLWIKQYDFPGANDWGDEMVFSDGGLVILGRNRVAPSDMYMFKTDTEGNVIWSYAYDFYANDNATPISSVQSQLIETGSNLFFTAYAQETGAADMILVKTGLDGLISDTCFGNTSVFPQVSLVSNPVFYDKLPDVENFVPQRNSLSLNAGITTNIENHPACLTANGITSTSVTQSICVGDMFEGYTQTGMYTDTFQSVAGCDSIRILNLEVLSVLTVTIEDEICPGQELEGYTEAGIYQDTFLSTFGCDSIRVLMLEVASPTINEELDLCAGADFNGITTDTMYTDTLQGVAETCDTIRNLTIHFLEPIHATFETTICEGELYDGYDNPGSYTDTLTTPAGCDSIRTVHLSIEEPSFVSIEAEVCDERFDGHELPGTYTDTLTSVNGCDSIRTLTLYGSIEYIPNVFSPNGDGQNDVFTIISYPFPTKEVIYFAIFDRFGDMAYEVKEGEIVWNGKDNNGKYYNPGVFVYIYKYRCNQKEVMESGSITLIR